MRPRISNQVKASGLTICGEKVITFVNKPIHVLALEIIKTVTPAGKVTVRRQDEVVYHTRVRKPQFAN